MNRIHPRTALVVSASAAFLATFNETYLNIGFTPIMNSLGVSISTVQWLATAYMLSAAVMIPVSAFAYRSIATRPLFLISVGLLIVGSVIGGAAPSFAILLAGRIIQALGTGLMIPVGMNITLEVAPKERLGVYLGIMCSMTVLGPSASVIMAGGFLSFFGWQSLLWSFAALSCLLFLMGLFLLPNVARLTHPKLDLASVALNVLALVGILYGLSTLFSGDIQVALGSAAIGAILLAVFVRRQKRLAQPLLHMEPLSSRPFAIGVVVNILALVVIFAMNILVPIFLQGAMGVSSLNASLTLFPAILLSCFVAPAVGNIYDKRGAGVLVPAGFFLMAVFCAALSFAQETNSLLLLAALYIPVICGAAMIIGPVQSLALSRVRRELHPHAVTMLSTCFQIGGCIGSSLFTGVYFAVISRRLSERFPMREAANHALLYTTLLGAAIAIAGGVLALRLGQEERRQNALAHEQLEMAGGEDVR